MSDNNLTGNVWECKIGFADDAALPPGADLPLRRAVRDAYVALTDTEPTFLFSGWGAQLTFTEREIVRDTMRARGEHV